MTSNLEVRGLSEDPAEREAVLGLQAQCFTAISSASGWDEFYRRIGRDGYRVAYREGRLVGALSIYALGQWFGGRSVPMAGIAAVGVPPELRGTGVARELMASTLRELHARGVPLSGLYASTQRLYRKVGYEQAGTRCQYALPLAGLDTAGLGTAGPEWPMRSVDPARHEAFHAMYRRRALAGNGNLDRSTAIWERAVLPRGGEHKRAYVVGPPGAEDGYLVYHQAESGSPRYNLLVSDLVALGAGAARRLLTFLAAHRSMAVEARWWGPPLEPLLFLLPEQSARVLALERWFLRLVHVPRALELRGYPEGVEGTLHLEVRDALLPANDGRLVLRVEQGAAAVEPGGRGELALDARALAPLYSGLYTPAELLALGQLEGAASALTTAARLFAGPQPWMPDMF